jgi:hypothetical protein
MAGAAQSEGPMADVKASVDQTTVIGNGDTLLVGLGIKPNTGGLDVSASSDSDQIVIGSTTRTGTLYVGCSTDTNSCNIASSIVGDGKTQTVNIGNGAHTGTGKTVAVLGAYNGASSTTIQAGTGGIDIGTSLASRTINIGTVSGAYPQTINIGTGTSAHDVIIGSDTSGAETVIKGGSGISINSTGNNGTLSLVSGTGSISIGADASAHSVTIGNQTGSTSVTINAGTGNIDIGTGNQARATNIATGAADQDVTIGSQTTGSSMSLKTAAGHLTIDQSTSGNVAFKFGVTINYASGANVIFIGDRTTIPTKAGYSASGGVLYSDGGALKWLGGSSSLTTMGPAGPHCEGCGYDAWRIAQVNANWKSWHFECAHCGAEYKGGPKTVHNLLTDAQKNEYIRQGMTWDEVIAVTDSPNPKK